jgi:hypothetical protein
VTTKTVMAVLLLRSQIYHLIYAFCLVSKTLKNLSMFLSVSINTYRNLRARKELKQIHKLCMLVGSVSKILFFEHLFVAV